MAWTEEDHIQARSVSWLESAYNVTGILALRVAFHIPNERASKAERIKLGRMGVQKGPPDWLFPGDLVIELKKPDGVLDPKQKSYLQYFASKGYRAFCCWGIAPFCEVVADFYGFTGRVDVERDWDVEGRKEKPRYKEFMP